MEFIASGIVIIKKVVRKVFETVSDNKPILPFRRSHPLEDIVVDRYEGYV